MNSFLRAYEQFPAGLQIVSRGLEIHKRKLTEKGNEKDIRFRL